MMKGDDGMKANRPQAKWRRWGIVVCGCAIGVVLASAAPRIRQFRKQQAANQWLTQTARFEQASDWHEATNCLENYLQLCPVDDQQRVRLARIALAATDNPTERERAIDHLYRALGTGLNEAIPLRRHLAEQLLLCQRWPEAMTESDKVLQTTPHDPQMLSIRAKALAQQYRTGMLQHAVPSRLPILEWLTEASQLNSNDLELAELTAVLIHDPELTVLHGVPLSDVKRVEISSACFDRVIARRPQDSSVFLARYRYRMKWSIAGANEDLAEALRLDGTDQTVLMTAAQAAQRDAEVLRAKGQDHLAQQRLRDASRFYQRAVDHDAIDPRVFEGLGDALIAADRPAEAIQAWHLGLANGSDSACGLHERLADAWMQLGDVEQAAQWIDRIDHDLENWPETNTEHARVSLENHQHLRRGWMLMQKSQPTGAIAHLQKAVTLLEGESGGQQLMRAWQLLGDAYAQADLWLESAAAYDNAVRERPEAADVWLAASRAYERGGDMEAAVERADQAVRLKPSRESELAFAKASLNFQLGLPAYARNLNPLKKSLTRLRDRYGEAGESAIEQLVAGVQSLQSRDGPVEYDTSLSTIERWHRTEWPTLASVHQLVRSRDSIPTGRAKLISADRRSELSLIQATIQSLRGEYEVAEETLLENLTDRSPVEQAEVYREVLQQRLARGDVERAHALLIELVKETPNNSPLLQLTAEVETRFERERAEWYESHIVP